MYYTRFMTLDTDFVAECSVVALMLPVLHGSSF